MMKVFLSFVLLVFLQFPIFGQSLTPFLIFNQKGEEVNFSNLVSEAEKADVVLFGEFHNNSMLHWLQLNLVEALYQKNKNLVLGAEMFETDNQLVLNEYLSGLIKESHFEKEAKIWNNYKTDYKPLVDFAKANQLPFVATNIPRRYASVVASKGINYLDSLPAEAKRLIAPLPIVVNLETPGYNDMMNMNMGHGMGMNPKNFVDAQASKDATMAYFIEQNFQKKSIFIHFNGDFHSKNYGGIYWYLKQSNPKLKILVISCEESNDFSFLPEWETRSDFLIITPLNIPKSY